MTPPFAVFVLAQTEGGYAATTRAADRGEAGRIGLPGGKVDAGESPLNALLRECMEEGWLIGGVCPDPIHAQLVDGKMVHWFEASVAVPLKSYKEIGRIQPIIVSKEAVALSGYGNENLPL